MQIDTKDLTSLWRRIDPSVGKSYNGRNVPPGAWKYGIWIESFKLDRLRGIQVPYFEACFARPPQSQNRFFRFFMEADGHSCSFLCDRPANPNPTLLTPANVRMDSNTIFKSVDPGETDIVMVYKPDLVFNPTDHNRKATMPHFVVDCDSRNIIAALPNKADARKQMRQQSGLRTTHVSGAEWRHLAGYNLKSRLREKNISAEVKTIQTNLGSGKTASLQVFQAYSRQTLFHYDTLREAHSQEAAWRFYTYIRRQKALHSIALRVKGPENSNKPRNEIVIAFGAGQFAATKGRRGAPTKTIIKALNMDMTVVMVDEHRTSKVCFKCRVSSPPVPISDDTASQQPSQEIVVAFEEEDFGFGELQEMEGDDDADDNTTTEVKENQKWDLRPMYETAGDKTSSEIHAVRHCDRCHTTWNRDACASGNISFVFWHERCNGSRPLGFLRTRSTS
ncbi:hypothetical protein DFS34DRAFT_696937 [Phlyctochytrium arcticum]|nr:hypothetical protein DFS34DRAFT_696937 [Phlyctochytrium arcticum]